MSERYIVSGTVSSTVPTLAHVNEYHESDIDWDEIKNVLKVGALIIGIFIILVAPLYLLYEYILPISELYIFLLIPYLVFELLYLIPVLRSYTEAGYEW